jgi:hypothetical protein
MTSRCGQGLCSPSSRKGGSAAGPRASGQQRGKGTGGVRASLRPSPTESSIFLIHLAICVVYSAIVADRNIWIFKGCSIS